MDWQELERKFGDFEVPDDEPVFPLKVVCHLVHIEYWTLHEIVKIGIIKCARGRRKRFFTPREVKRIKIVKYLMDEKGVNLNGVKLILDMRDE